MALKIKELKDDVLIDVTVNKSYYMMLKSALLYLFKNMSDDERSDEGIKSMMTGDYGKMSEIQQVFFTITLMVTDIEKKAIDNDHFTEKEVLEPGDEGYVEPTQE